MPCRKLGTWSISIMLMNISHLGGIGIGPAWSSHAFFCYKMSFNNRLVCRRKDLHLYSCASAELWPCPCALSLPEAGNRNIYWSLFLFLWRWINFHRILFIAFHSPVPGSMYSYCSSASKQYFAENLFLCCNISMHSNAWFEMAL